MAYLPPDDELKKQQAAMGTSPSSDSGGGASVGSAPPPAQSNPSTFVNLSDYLAPNAGAAQQMGQGLASQLDTQARNAAGTIGDYASAWDTNRAQNAANQKTLADWTNQTADIQGRNDAATAAYEADQKHSPWVATYPPPTADQAERSKQPLTPDQAEQAKNTPNHDAKEQAGLQQYQYMPKPTLQALPDKPTITDPATPDPSAASNAANNALGLFSVAQDQGGRAAMLANGSGDQYTEGQRGLDAFLTGAEGMAPVNQTISNWTPMLQQGPDAWSAPGMADYLTRKRNGGY